LKITEQRHRFALALTLIVLLSALPRLVLAPTQYIEYDGYWHIFIAQQDNWKNFWADIRANAHPPLFFLLLKLMMKFGHTPLIYRSISLATGIASVFAVGSIARKVVESELWALTAALAYGMAMPGIIMSNEVRSYMLGALLILLSFSCLISLVTSATPERSFKLRTGFALAAILACFSHYYAFFYGGAATLMLLVWVALRRFRGERVNGIAEAATILPAPAVIVYLYETHANLKAEIQDHLLPYYFDPAGHESVAAFLVRNVRNLINLFSPYEVSGNIAAMVIFTLAAIAAVALLVGFLRAPDGRTRRASWTILMTAAILVELAIMGVAGKYPFGGDLRQQFLLFPFFVLCAAILADRLTANLPGKVRSSLIAAAAILIAAVSTQQFERYPKIPENLMSSEISIFNQLEPSPAGVYLDQFNLITFFIYHHDWNWVSLKQQPIPGIDIYRIGKGAQHMLVFRDTNEWNAKPADPAFYHKLAECLRDSKIDEVSLFGPLQSPPAAPYYNFRGMRRTISRLAADEKVCPQRLTINSVGWYGAFRASGCTAPDLKPPQSTGTFDDLSDDIDYTGVWTHTSFAAASGGTLSFSNDPVASARLTFHGTEITWMYAKAWNRGIVSVTIDGMPRGDFDLYNPTIVWQSHTTFTGLAPGDHTFQLAPTGRKRPAATDRYMDIDALVVR
jgi:uncharacterized membrane protein